MADYKRLVSYIYAYPGGVRDKNVGFAKAEVRNGQFKLTVSVKGVYTDTPELFGVYVMVDGKKHQPGGFTLLKTGTVMVNQGIGQYQDLFNPMNINQLGYTFEDISGIALARENEDFYRMFSLWEDCILNTEDITFAQAETEAAPEEAAEETVEETVEEVAAEAGREELTSEMVLEKAVTRTAGEMSVKEQASQTAEQVSEGKSAETSGKVQKPEPVRQEMQPASVQSAGQQTDLQQETAQMKAQQVRAMEAVQELLFRNTNPQGTMPQNTKLQNAKPQEEMPAFEKVFINRDFIDAFEDDYFYDCVEVTPELLKQLPIEDDAVVNNSFLVHGYYNFKHILFGKVCENDNNTRYFIGVPGMYCNRERFMASMFGFCNFKKSHRSDYSNPYFGYWYQEI